MNLKKLDIKKILVWVSVPLLFWGSIIWVIVQSCSRQQTLAPNQQEQQAPTSFKLPDIPTGIISLEERANYLVMHYWEHFNLADTSHIHSPQVSEQALVDYLVLFPYISPQVRAASINRMLKQAEGNNRSLMYWIELLEKYLYDPNSPMLNEDYYTTVLKYIAESPQISEAEKSRFQFQLTGISLNRVGMQAADFTCTGVNGMRYRMCNISSEYTLIFFYNPDCADCQRVKEELEMRPETGWMVDHEELTVLAIYVDENRKAWEEYQSQLPIKWLNAFDDRGAIRGQRLYDLRATPSLYLLDKNKKVLLKDASVEKIEAFFTKKG